MWTILIFCAILLYFFAKRSKTQLSYPPGPTPLPVLGNIFSVCLKVRQVKNHFKLWQAWGQQYGEILGLRLGFINVVVVSGKDYIKEVSTREVFQGRPNGFLYTMRSFGKKLGVVFSDGPKWSKTRRFVLKCLKNFGYNTRFMESYISEECKALVKLRMSDAGRPVLVNTMFHVTIINILWRLVAGKSDGQSKSSYGYPVMDTSSYGHPVMDMTNNLNPAEFLHVGTTQEDINELNFAAANRSCSLAITVVTEQQLVAFEYDLNDARLNNLCSLITKLFKAVDMSGGVLTFLPFLRHVMPDLTGYTELRSIHNELHAFIEETIKAHRETIDVTHPRDVIDAFIIETMEQNDEPFTQEDLQVICLDLLEAGMETVSNTAAFMLLHIVRNEDVQRKLHQEIDEMIGFSRSPKVDDRTRMVYTEAVLLETLRISTVAAVGIPHMALEDAQLGNYTIPKGTFILLAMYDLHNGSHWKDPEIFRPERFLTREGNLLQDEWLIPFGTGKRRCIGEGLARSELFMFITHLLQRFDMTIPDGEALPSAEPIDGLSLSAQPFRVVFKPRF